MLKSDYFGITSKGLIRFGFLPNTISYGGIAETLLLNLKVYNIVGIIYGHSLR